MEHTCDAGNWDCRGCFAEYMAESAADWFREVRRGTRSASAEADRREADRYAAESAERPRPRPYWENN